MKKYRNFVNDYNSGLSRESLCSKYSIKDEDFEAFLAFLKRKGYRLSRNPQREFTTAHEIDFEVFGDDMQFVVIELDPGESVIAEAGAMMFMEDFIEMNTIFGDGSQESESLIGKLFGAGKRILTGESLFMTAFTNRGSIKQHVAFGAPYPGKIIPFDLKEHGGEIICQKDGFLCAAKGISIGIAFQRRLGVGFFGGEGFILQRITGDGYAFVHAGGAIMEKELASGEVLRVDTGCLVAFENTVDYDVELVRGIKSALFGGEGLFFATLRGPGRVWLQSLPFSRLADRIYEAAPKTGSKRVGEGSILGGLGDLLNDDNRV
ncbi:MAG: TIGR00266 family protein [Nitrospirae bacterium]|nr:MAG: TIGR00266 family protein [Nitrospirota bacterium]